MSSVYLKVLLVLFMKQPVKNSGTKAAAPWRGKAPTSKVKKKRHAELNGAGGLGAVMLLAVVRTTDAVV
ncbi:MAG: hypothetical protein ACR5K7_06130 [Symbiopectobacterium sp.]